MDTKKPLGEELVDGVLSLTMNRPPVNALNLELLLALQEAFKHAAQNPAVRCVMLAGANQVFSAGQDLKDFQPESEAPIRSHLLHAYNPLILQIRHLEKAVVAAIDGLVSGAALGLALACDMRIAADRARFVVGFTRIGLSTDSAVSLLLPAIIGLGRASEYTFTNLPFEAKQALAWGLVNRLVDSQNLNAETLSLTRELAQGPVGAMGLAKRAFNKAVLCNLEQVLDYEAHLQEIAGKGLDHKEGISAFLEKRPPKYS
jgi:2-(1,2-epoxy-1,2-dihydrophenyl)acetyl-CoA isomerase